MRPRHRINSVAGVARALMGTIGVDESVHILLCQYGWDVTFAALARCEGPDGCAALWQVVTRLRSDGPPV